MKLYEEFKEVEGLWEESEPVKPVLKQFGRKTYDISKKDALEAWVNANVEFQMKRHPARYDSSNTGDNPNLYPEGEWNTRTVRIDILHNLLDTLSVEPSTKVVRDNIWELITDTAKESQKKVKAFYDARAAETNSAKSAGDVEEAYQITKAELKEMIKAALREELTSATSIIESTNFVPADEIPSSGKYALAFAFYDYGWYWKAIDENMDGSTCTTTHRSDGKFYKDAVYTGRLYDSIESCIAEVNHNIEDYLQYTLPEKIDYVSGRKNGSIGIIELNDTFDGYADIIPIFNCKAGKLIPTKN